MNTNFLGEALIEFAKSEAFPGVPDGLLEVNADYCEIQVHRVQEMHPCNCCVKVESEYKYFTVQELLRAYIADV